MSAGEKFADSDLIGIPWRIVISERSLKDGGVEVLMFLADNHWNRVCEGVSPSGTIALERVDLFSLS